MSGFPPVEDVASVLGVSTEGADVGAAVEAFGDLFGGEGEAGFEAAVEGGCWAHDGAAWA